MMSMFNAPSDLDYQAQFEPAYNSDAARRRADYLLTDLTEAIESGDAERVEAARKAIDNADEQADVAIITYEDVQLAESRGRSRIESGHKRTEAEIEAYMEGAE